MEVLILVRLFQQKSPLESSWPAVNFQLNPVRRHEVSCLNRYIYHVPHLNRYTHWTDRILPVPLIGPLSSGCTGHKLNVPIQIAYLLVNVDVDAAIETANRQKPEDVPCVLSSLLLRSHQILFFNQTRAESATRKDFSKSTTQRQLMSIRQRSVE
jgi:hypothetical protein